MANLSNINGKFVVEQTTGYVGIGTTNPNFLIEAAGTNAELALNAASIYRVRSTSNDEFIITKNGVGDRLTIAPGGAITMPGTVTIGNSAYGSSLGQLRIINDAASSPASLSLFGYNNVADNTDFAIIEFAMQSSGTGGNVLASIKGQSDGTSENAADLRFGTANVTTGLTEKMRITSGGNIGIGTTSPANPLHIQAAQGGMMRITDSSGNLGAYTEFSGGYAYQYYYQLGGSVKIALQTNGSSYFNGGNVGIGDTSPAKPLVVYSAAPPGGITIKAQSGNASNWIQNVSTGSSWQIGSTSTGWQLYNDNTSGYRVTVTNDGKVGIGVSSGITRQLEVNTSGGWNNGISLNSSSGDGAGLRLNCSATGGNEWYLISTGSGNGGGAGHLGFYNNTAGDYLMYLKTVSGGARLGLGTTAPSWQLEVEDDTTVRAAVTSTNNGTAGAYFRVFLDGNQVGNGTIATQNNGDMKVFTGTSGETERMRILGSGVGAVMIRRTSSIGDYFLQVGDASLDNGYPIYCTVASTAGRTQINFSNYNNNSVGSISTSGSATSFNTSSDYRLKEDLKEFNGLDIVSQIKTYDFKWKDNDDYEDCDKRGFGVIAHEIETILPQIVKGEKDAVNKDGSINPQGVDYAKIVPLLVKSIQELKQEIETLKTQINN